MPTDDRGRYVTPDGESPSDLLKDLANYPSNTPQKPRYRLQGNKGVDSIQKDYEKRMALYGEEGEAIEGQIKRFYNTKRANWLNQLLSAGYGGTTTFADLLSQIGAEQGQKLALLKKQLKELMMQEKQLRQLKYDVQAEEGQKFLGSLLNLAGKATAFIPGVGPAIAPFVNPGDWLGLGTETDIKLSAEQAKQAEISKQLLALQNFFSEIQATSPELQMTGVSGNDEDRRSAESILQYMQPGYIY